MYHIKENLCVKMIIITFTWNRKKVVKHYIKMLLYNLLDLDKCKDMASAFYNTD
jgi:hypothetical protein